jgi:hypothetical protein
MKKILLALALLPVFFTATKAQSIPTWSDDVAPLIYTNCTGCHHPGGLAPFSLMTFADAYAKRFDIVNAISTGEMPPWPPDPNYRHFKDERYLTPAQISVINAWNTNNAPEGNQANAPAPPVYNNLTALPHIDAAMQIPTFTVPSISQDLYQCFVIPAGSAAGKTITGFEVIPGDPSIVHHVLIYEDTSGQAALLDAGSPEPGYAQFGGIGVNNPRLIGGWVPGTRPEVYPSGMGVKLNPNSDLVVQIHYPNGSDLKTDSTRINLMLTSANLRSISINPFINHFSSITNGPLVLAPNQTKTFTAEFTVPYTFSGFPIPGVSVVNIAPHAHLICKNWAVWGETPQGDTIPLIKIDNWDFHWQGFYTFQKLMKIPPGTTVKAVALYDNTTNNPHNPSNPPQQVAVGEATTDEMMLVYFSYMLYQNGDENFVIDSSILEPTPNAIEAPTKDMVSTIQMYEPTPNPANDMVSISYYLPSSANEAEIRIYDITGKLVLTEKAGKTAGHNSQQVSIANLAQGQYVCTLTTEKGVKSKQLIVSH